MITLTLLYPDGTKWIAGGFATLSDANAWVTREQAKPGWSDAIQVQIVDNTPPSPTQAQLTAQAWSDLKVQRDSLLAATKWIQDLYRNETEMGVPTTTSAATYKLWLAYWVQVLRAIPKAQAANQDPSTVVWPTPPGVTT